MRSAEELAALSARYVDTIDTESDKFDELTEQAQKRVKSLKKKHGKLTGRRSRAYNLADADHENGHTTDAEHKFLRKGIATKYDGQINAIELELDTIHSAWRKPKKAIIDQKLAEFGDKAGDAIGEAIKGPAALFGNVIDRVKAKASKRARPETRRKGLLG